MSTNAMNFGPAWMRVDASKSVKTDAGQGRNSPSAQSNGLPFTNTTTDSPLQSHNGTSAPGGRTNSFSYSSVLTSAPAQQMPSLDAGNGVTNHEKPFKYSRDEMLNIWKNNAAKFRSSGIPLEFEKHEPFTSEETLEPALLTEMTAAELEAFAGPINSDKPDLTSQGRLDRPGRQFPQKTDRSQPSLSGSIARSSLARHRSKAPSEFADAASSRGESNVASTTPNRPLLRPSKSRDFFSGAFAGPSGFATGGSPPDRDIWGSATKKGSFDEHGKFIVAEDKHEAHSFEPDESRQEKELPELGDMPPNFASNESNESPQTSTDFSLPPVGRGTSRFSSFTIPDDQPSNPPEEEHRPAAVLVDQLTPQPYNDDHEDDVLKDILNMTQGDQTRAISPPHEQSQPQIDRLTSRFASQSLNQDPSGNYNTFGAMGPGAYEPAADPLRRETNMGLFEHPVVPQPALPPPPPQTTRVMIMADKLKWVYKDPQGNTQGPFTGLEMHEWYRGGYFHPTLEVKREDDPHFEQLQTLVKRIGNQREPFLVPLPSKTQTQLIPPRSTTTLSGWNTTLFGEGLEDSKQWVGLPPSLVATGIGGTTLTADQQNALERRKQEEQYILVRQREIAAQQQLHTGVPPYLPQHNLMGNFGGYPPIHQLPVGITHHVHTPAPVQVQTLPALDTLRTGGSAPQTQPSPQAERSQQVLQGPQNRSCMSPWGTGPLGPLSVQIQSQPGEFQQYPEEEAPLQERKASLLAEAPIENIEPDPAIPEAMEDSGKLPISVKTEAHLPQIELEVAYMTAEPELVAETVSAEPLEESPATTAGSITRVAPWAITQKADETRRSLSLKEIQEIEVKRATEQARQLAAQRQQLLAQQAAAAPTLPVQPGLPQSSTWGSVAAKGWSQPKVTHSTSSPGKKTMAQIQKEEEEERNKLIAAKSKDGASITLPVKGYAGAAAAAVPKPAIPSASWTVVGPGGRPQAARATATPNAGVAPAPVISTSATRGSSARSQSESKPVKGAAQSPATGIEDFQRWCRSQLKSLSGVNCALTPRSRLTVDDDIYQMMVSLPPNESSTQEIISDTIYAHSSTLDGRHFAEEFLKRRKALGTALDVTIVSLVTPPSSSGGSGWNEVTKKEKTPKDPSGEWNSAFKVVSGKKGRRRG